MLQSIFSVLKVQGFFNDIKNGCISLQKEEEDEKDVYSDLGKYKKEIQRANKCNNKHTKPLQSIGMIILEWYLRLNTNQFMEKDSKYELLNKCFKDYQ